MLDVSREENITIGDLAPFRIEGAARQSLPAQMLLRRFHQQCLVLGFEAVKHLFGWFDPPCVGIADALGKRCVQRGKAPVQFRINGPQKTPVKNALTMMMVTALGLSVQIKSHPT
ncbi:hypothetical protein [Mesorhizobium opportunistum]|uniref:hypothetical protein n=1 Tax=Mesorhizobium opportunistum TaxID=593909 RepID=UPI003DA1AA09